MALELYYFPGSAPCQIVFLVAKALNLELKKIPIKLMEGEHLKPGFLGKNPQHTVPTLVDNTFIIWESRAIITYLQNKYSKNDKLYPKDPANRAKIDQRLYFDATTLFPPAMEYFKVTFFGKPESINQDVQKKIEDALSYLETFLDGNDYVGGTPNLSLADISIVVTVSYLEFFEFDLSHYKNIVCWLEKMKTEIPGYQGINGKETLKKLFAPMRK